MEFRVKEGNYEITPIGRWKHNGHASDIHEAYESQQKAMESIEKRRDFRYIASFQHDGMTLLTTDGQMTNNSNKSCIELMLPVKSVFGGGQTIANEESGNHFSHFVRYVFVNCMAALRQHLHLKFALHLSHCQFFVQAIYSGQQEQFSRRNGQKCGGQAVKPSRPVFLRLSQVDAPLV